MSADAVPVWLDAIILVSLGLINFLSGAYEAALQASSRSRIQKALEERRPPAASFLARIASNDPAIPMRTDLLYVFSAALFMSYGIWARLGAGEGAPLGRFCLGVAAYLALLLVIRMGANPIGDYFAHRWVIGAALPMAVLSAPFHPIAGLALGAERIVIRVFGAGEEDEVDEREAEVIDAVSDGQLDGVVEDREKEMIEGIFEFKDSDVVDIFVPRTEMTMVNADAPLADAVRTAIDKGYSRLPAFKGNRDNIVGIFHVRDALRHWHKPPGECPPLADILKPPLFVPETKPISELLTEMRRGQSHMAVVLDEYGGTAGLVTIEDVIEEIIGDIQDEFDSLADGDDGKVEKMDDDTLVVAGQAHVGEVNKMLGAEIIPEDENFETVAGFVLGNLGHIPKVGESFVYEDVLTVRVLQADERRVLRVRLQMARRPEE